MTARTRPRTVPAGELKRGDMLLVRILEVRSQPFPDDEPWTVVKAELGGVERILSWASSEAVEIERLA